jgi:hypothetical protein
MGVVGAGWKTANGAAIDEGQVNKNSQWKKTLVIRLKSS